MAQPTYFDKYNLFIPVTYYYKNSSDTDDLTAELNSHDFVLYYDSNDAESTDSRLVLHLRHNVSDTEVQRSDYGREYRHFNIASVLSDYANKYGVSMPDKIVIEYEKSSSSSYENVSSEKVEVEYKSLLKRLLLIINKRSISIKKLHCKVIWQGFAVQFFLPEKRPCILFKTPLRLN